MSAIPGSCCHKSLGNIARSHFDALAASMTGHIVVPLCACIDAFGFRIMCTGPIDDANRRLLIGRATSSSDVLGGANAAADEGVAAANGNVPVHNVALCLQFVTAFSIHDGGIA